MSAVVQFGGSGIAAARQWVSVVTRSQTRKSHHAITAYTPLKTIELGAYYPSLTTRLPLALSF